MKHKFKRTGPNMLNRKPYRTKEQKAMARATAVLEADGTWRSTAPVSYHTEIHTPHN